MPFRLERDHPLKARPTAAVQRNCNHGRVWIVALSISLGALLTVPSQKALAQWTGCSGSGGVWGGGRCGHPGSGGSTGAALGLGIDLGWAIGSAIGDAINNARDAPHRRANELNNAANVLLSKIPALAVSCDNRKKIEALFQESIGLYRQALSHWQDNRIIQVNLLTSQIKLLTWTECGSDWNATKRALMTAISYSQQLNAINPTVANRKQISSLQSDLASIDGFLLFKQGDYKQAVKSFKLALKFDPNSSYTAQFGQYNAANAEAHLAYSEGNVEIARAKVQEALSSTKSPTDSLKQLMQKLASENNSARGQLEGIASKGFKGGDCFDGKIECGSAQTGSHPPQASSSGGVSSPPSSQSVSTVSTPKLETTNSSKQPAPTSSPSGAGAPDLVGSVSGPWSELRLQLPPQIPQTSLTSEGSPTVPLLVPLAPEKSDQHPADCIGSPAGSATFGIEANPDRPRLDCSTAVYTPSKNEAWTELTAKQLYAYNATNSLPNIGSRPKFAERPGVSDSKPADQILTQPFTYRDCLVFIPPRNGSSARLENRCAITLRYSLCFINDVGGINPLLKPGQTEISPAYGAGAVPESAVNRNALGNYFTFDDVSRRFVFKNQVTHPGLLEDVPTLPSYTGLKLRAEPASGPRTEEIDCQVNTKSRTSLDAIAIEGEPISRRQTQTDACEAIQWAPHAADPDLVQKPLAIEPNACAEPDRKRCLRLNELVSSITHPEFKRFVKTRVNFVIRNLSSPAGSPMTSVCAREQPSFSKCAVFIYPEFWEIKNEKAQELVLILETGKIASIMTTTGMISQFHDLNWPPSRAHLACLKSIYKGETLLGDSVDDSALGLSIIATLPIMSSR